MLNILVTTNPQLLSLKNPLRTINNILLNNINNSSRCQTVYCIYLPFHLFCQFHQLFARYVAQYKLPEDLAFSGAGDLPKGCKQDQTLNIIYH